jgi:hypothetical protein
LIKKDQLHNTSTERESSVLRRRLATAGVRSNTLNERSVESTQKILDRSQEVEKNLTKAYAIKAQNPSKPQGTPKFVDIKKQSYCNGQSETFGNKNSVCLPKTAVKDASDL